MNRRILGLAFMSLATPYVVAAQTRQATPTRTAPASRIHLVLAPTGNEARFIARETLAGAIDMNDAIGVTDSIKGSITLDEKGKVDPAASKITVDLRPLKSDKDRRDGYIQRNTIQTAQFPYAELVIKDLQGLPAKLPTAGSIAMTLTGDLTIHGVTKSSTWQVTVDADPSGFTGTATTHIKFEDYGMVQPKVPIVLSVVDDVKLEYSFHFVRDTAKP